MATHTSILAWKIPWTKKPDGLQSVGLQRVAHNSACTHTHTHTHTNTHTQSQFIYRDPQNREHSGRAHFANLNLNQPALVRNLTYSNQYPTTQLQPVHLTLQSMTCQPCKEIQISQPIIFCFHAASSNALKISKCSKSKRRVLQVVRHYTPIIHGLFSLEQRISNLLLNCLVCHLAGLICYALF